jgi:hypothetical protein
MTMRIMIVGSILLTMVILLLLWRRTRSRDDGWPENHSWDDDQERWP